VARTQAVTILFCDLVKSTERRARLGDDAFDVFIKRFMGELRAAIAEFQGREVSSAGDGLMAVFPDSVADGLECAASMHRRVALLDTDDPPRLRVGISCGEVAQDGDEYSGMPIVEAARLEAAAQPGQTLANAVVRSLVGSRRAFHFRDVGALSLKGIPEPLATIAVVDPAAVGDDGTPGAPVATPAGPATGPPPRSERRSRRRALVVGAAVAVLLALIAAGIAVASGGGSGSTQSSDAGLPQRSGYTPRYQDVTCPPEVRAESADARCGHLVVPQDRSKPQGRQVTLLVKRAPARGTTRGGVAPTIDLCGCENLGNSITRDHSELIQLSQRGFAPNDPSLACPEMAAVTTDALTKPANDPATVERGATALGQCYDRLTKAGIDPAQYNDVAAAQDALDLMIALHINQADFTASGDVSTELLEIVRHAPGAVRSITIDNPVAPGYSELSDPVSDLATAFGRFGANCKADPACAASYPDLASAWRNAYNVYQATPPLVTTTDPNDSSAATLPVLLDGPRAADALAAALSNPDTYKLIPSAISSRADAVVAGQYAASDFGSFHPDTALWGAVASYQCAYGAQTIDSNAADLEAKTLPQFTRALPSHWATWCKAWKVPSAYDELSREVASPVPALLFRGDLSPFGNEDWLRRVQRGLSRDQSVTFATLGGDLLANGPPCLSALRLAFLANPTAKLDTAACSKQSPAITFVAPG
jgi:class 3 adenylate cyclase